jgi:hypothetical protein
MCGDLFTNTLLNVFAHDVINLNKMYGESNGAVTATSSTKALNRVGVEE